MFTHKIQFSLPTAQKPTGTWVIPCRAVMVIVMVSLKATCLSPWCILGTHSWRGSLRSTACLLRGWTGIPTLWPAALPRCSPALSSPCRREIIAVRLCSSPHTGLWRWILQRHIRLGKVNTFFYSNIIEAYQTISSMMEIKTFQIFCWNYYLL